MASAAPAADGMTAVTDDVVADVRRCFQVCVDADHGQRARARDELLFLSGEHWDEQARRQRELDGRPCLTVNTLPATLAMVVNNIRQNRQAVHVHAAGGGADPKVAEIFEGMIRHIEASSGADAAYDTAAACAASIGFGFFRLVNEWEAPDSFDQRLCIKRVRNPFAVYFDPRSQEADGSDARFCIVAVNMARADFVREYPQASATAAFFETGSGDWVMPDTVRVAEFYRVEEVPAVVCLLSTGESGYKDELGSLPLPPGVSIVRERQSSRRRVMWYKCTGAEVLESAEVPCDWIPVFPVWGQEIDIDGRVDRCGLVRNAKDPSLMYDFFLTTATEEVAMRPKAPYIGAVGQFETAKADWASANMRNFAYLEYDPVTVDGQIAGPPQRQPMADVPAGALQMAAMMRDNIKAATGIYDASLGARGNETSGVGIRARQQQGDLANFHIADNLARAIRHLGRCLVCMIPRVYDTERVVRLLGEDGSASLADVNKREVAGDEFGRLVEVVMNDLSVGKYDVTVTSGPSYGTQRAEAVEKMVQVGQAFPQLWQVAGDKMVAAMDWPNAQEIAERLAKTLPPELRDKEGGDGGDGEAAPQVMTPKGPLSVEEAGQLIGQMSAVLDEMGARLEAVDAELEKQRIAARSREEVARINATGRLDVAELKGMIALLIERMQPPIALQEAALDAQVTPAEPTADDGADGQGAPGAFTGAGEAE